MATRWLWLTASVSAALCGGCPTATQSKGVRPAPKPADVAPYRITDPVPSQATKVGLDRPPIAELDDVACTFETGSWHEAGRALPLSLKAGNKPWGSLDATPRGNARVRASVASNFDDAVVEITHAGLRLRSRVPAHALGLRAKQDRRFGYVSLSPQYALEITAIDEGTARVEMKVTDIAPPKNVIRFEVPCDGITLGRVATPYGHKAGSFDSVTTSGPLYDAPGGKELAYLDATSLAIDVLKSRDGFHQIRGLSGNLWLHGWVRQTTVSKRVDAANLDLPSPASGTNSSHSSGGGHATAPPAAKRTPLLVRCERAVPLVVFQHGLARTVGQITPGAKFEPSATFGDLIAIEVADLGITFHHGAFYMDKDDLARHCRVADNRE